MDVWIAVVLSHDHKDGYAGTSVALTHDELMERLRENFDPEGELADAPNAFLVPRMQERFNLSIHIENHVNKEATA